MRRYVSMLLLLVPLLAACGGNVTAPEDPLPLLNAAAAHVNNAESFRIEIWQQGAPYYIESDVIEGDLTFDRATMDYVAPDILQGRIRAQLAGLPFEFGIMGRGEYQWVRLPGAGWTDRLYFAPGFNPRTLIAEDSGFQAALSALIDIEMIGAETLETGDQVWHMRGQADGPAVSELMVYIISAEDPVTIDAYVRRDDNRPVRLMVTIPDTETEENPEPTQFVLDLYDINAVDPETDITGPSYDDEPTPAVTPLLEQETPEAESDSEDAEAGEIEEEQDTTPTDDESDSDS